MPVDSPRIAERDGDVVRIISGVVEVIATMSVSKDEIVLDRLSIDGGGSGSLGFRRLRELARIFAVNHGVRRIRIRGTVRTTGANPGKFPREIIIEV